MSNLSDRIFELEDVDAETVEVPAWGMKLEVRSMTGLERAGMLEKYITGDGTMNVRDLYPSLIIACVYDPETGEKVFGPQDHDRLNGRNAAALEKLAQAAMRLSGIGAQDQEQLGKDSSPEGSDASTST
jgi:hypothetical protein